MHKPCVCFVAAAAGLAVAAPSARADFVYNDFSSINGLTLAGVATKAVNVIQITPNVSASAGAAWYTAAKQDLSLGFDTTFSIRIDDRHGAGADGFAFVLQNSSEAPLGGPGGALGYADNLVFGQMGIPNSLAVEIDMWNNSPANWPDFSSSHISVQTRGLLTNSPSQTDSLGAVNIPDLSDGFSHTIRVLYSPGTLAVFLDGAGSPTLQVSVNLAAILSLDDHGGATAGQGWVGITGATGAPQDVQTQVLESWRFAGTAIPAPATAALIAAAPALLARRRRAAQ